MVIPVGIKIALCFSKSHAAAAQSVEAPVEKRVCVGGIQKRRLCPQFFRIRRSSEVEEAEGVVIQGIRVVRSRLRLRPRVIFAGLLEVYFDQCRFHLAEIAGAFVGHLLQALHQQFLQRVRNRMLSTHVKIIPARNACERAGGVSSVRPGLIAEIHFQHAHCPAVNIRPVCQLLMGSLLRRAVSWRHASPAGSHQRRVGIRVGVSFSLRLLSFCCRQERSRPRDAEVGDLGLPRVCQEQVVRFHVLMDKLVVMGVLQAAGKLDGNIKQTLLYLVFPALIQRPVSDVVLEVAVLHPLGEDRRDPVNLPHIVAGHDIGMQSQVDPVPAFFLKAAFLVLRPEGLVFRSLHGQVCVPSCVVHTPYCPHAPANGLGFHMIRIHDHIAGMIVCDRNGGRHLRKLRFFVCLLRF